MPKKYHEVVIDGPRGWTLGFIEGFVKGRSAEWAVLDAESEGFDVQTIREKLQEILFRGSEVSHLLVESEILHVVREAIVRAQRNRLALNLLLERPIASASFAFEFRTYSPEHAKRIRGYFENLPPGARLSEDATFEERLDPSAHGVEVYAPAHEFELEGRGAVLGDVEPVLRVYRQCAVEDLIAESRIELQAG